MLSPSGKVLNGSLRAVDFKAGQFPSGPKGEKGDRGEKGDKGTKGDKGLQGSPGLSGYEIVRKSTTIPPNTSSSAQAGCPARQEVIGGAASIQGVPSNATTIHTQPHARPLLRRPLRQHISPAPPTERRRDLRPRYPLAMPLLAWRGFPLAVAAARALERGSTCEPGGRMW